MKGSRERNGSESFLLIGLYWALKIYALITFHKMDRFSSLYLSLGRLLSKRRRHGSDAALASSGASPADKGEENEDGAHDKTDEQPTQCLKLEISDSFLTSIALMLSWDRNAFLQSKYNDRIKYEELTTAQNQHTSAKNYKKVSTELPLLSLTIGNKKLIVCKLFYEKLTRRVDIPFSDITSLLVCFDNKGFDTLRIKPLPGKFTSWKVDDSKEDNCFPESKFVFLEIEKGKLEKGLAKLLYIDPRLQRTVEFARASGDQHMYQGRVHAHTQQTNMSAPQPFLSVNEHISINCLLPIRNKGLHVRLSANEVIFYDRSVAMQSLHALFTECAFLVRPSLQILSKVHSRWKCATACLIVRKYICEILSNTKD
ncbi:hypothetical protein C2845_PM10G08880 [Panicum miliaceum]|uniref:Uncharacterized protein n=1 Tax=Panicum miliaceum TaxID=4540 RepID=A0A3L6PCW6_PANMI|nr:hypothetical protein C2845_PM10G08880 [Panicum miliaceum]